jgi:ABC-type Fe3+-hydroxamate transport system substrate-binding protein
MRPRLAVFTLLVLTVLASGCASSGSSLKLSTTEVSIQGNESKQIGFRVFNAANETRSFEARVVPPQTEERYVNIKGNKTVYDLGDALDQSHTSWKYIELQGIPENVDGQAVAISLHIQALETGSNQTQFNKTVAVTIQK